MKVRWFTWTLALALPLAAVGCGTQETAQQSETTVTTSERTEYEGTAERKLGELGAKIDSLKAELDAAGEKAKAETRQELQELETKRQNAQRKLDELRAAGADRWQEMKQEMAGMLDELDAAFDRMRNRLRG